MLGLNQVGSNSAYFSSLKNAFLIGGCMLESSFERVTKEHLPIRLLDKGIAH